MDSYRLKNKIVLWIKTPEKEIRLEKDFQSIIYMHEKGAPFLKENNISFKKVKKQTYLRKYKEVLEIPAPNEGFEKFIRDIERATKHRIPLYNADIKPEQMFFYKNDLKPCCAVMIEENNMTPLKENEPIPLIKIYVNVIPSGDIYLNQDVPIKEIELNNRFIQGTEESILKEFKKQFMKIDPDVIIMDYAFSRMPYLTGRLKKWNIECPINRWDDFEIKCRGGRSYWSYGQVRYQDYAVRLRGRFLIDANSFVGTECEPEAIAELAELSGTLFQQTASRSFGAAFQTALIREMIRRDFLVPFKEKPIERPLSMLEMLKADRAGHTFDPKVGFHKDVAEIDFVSMFPWLIYNHNISADCMLTDKGPFVSIPSLPVKTSMAYKGLIPTALKPFIDRRMYYKKNPTAVNKKRAQGLKWVLVSCYGYLRFREFKLGIPTSHMAICAYARETLLKVIRLAEEKGFEIVHAIVDSVFIQKKNITSDEVKEFCKEVEVLTGIPINMEGIFKWVVFLPSVIDAERPLPSTYYGVFRDGKIKARGIEIRQRSAPAIVKSFQSIILEYMKECDTKKEIIDKVPLMCKYLRNIIRILPKLHPDYLVIPLRVSKRDYINSIPQKIIVEKLEKKGIRVMPGQFIKYIFQKDSAVLPEEYNGKPNIERYKKLLIKSLFVVLQPFGFRKEYIIERSGFERQTKIQDFFRVKFKYIPIIKQYDYRAGLSEKLIKEKLEKEGWIVWRGSLIGILRSGQELYPNVKKKYEKLESLLEKNNPGKIQELQYMNAVHHGMPDFICFRVNRFKFIECKLQYESLSKVQKKCIEKLTEMGFEVEVHKIVDQRTKTREAYVEVISGNKYLLEKQCMVQLFNE